MLRLILAILLLWSCSSTDATCAVAGSSYVAQYTLQSGDCGELSTEIIYIGDSTQATTCGVQEGCGTRISCTNYTPQCTIITTTDLRFVNDGSSAEGTFVLTADCQNGYSCSASYQTHLKREMGLIGR